MLANGALDQGLDWLANGALDQGLDWSVHGPNRPWSLFTDHSGQPIAVRFKKKRLIFLIILRVFHLSKYSPLQYSQGFNGVTVAYFLG